MNLQLKHVLIVCLMLFFCFLNFSAYAGQEKLPAQVADLLSSKTTDYSGVVSQLSDRQLPLAFAAAELLKFKAAHSEITLSVDEAESFAGLISQRIEHSQVISFKQNDICCSPVESWEIVFEGQKLIVPAHFIANLDLAIVNYQPTGEAGSIFPFFCIDVFSQTPLVTNSFKIDGETICSGKIKIARKSDSENYQLSYQSDFDVAGILQIGTHTAVINLKNQAGEQISRSWQFTVGIYDCATEKLPINATLLKVVDLPMNKVLPVCSSSGQLTVMVFQNKTGQIFTEYRLKSENVRVFTSQNLAFIGRQIISGGNRENELTISPSTTHAFAGNGLNFTYTYIGSGKIIAEEWKILNGSYYSNNPNITMQGDVSADCTINVEHTSTDAKGNPVVFQVTVYANKKIDCFEVNPQFKQDRKLLLSNDNNCAIAFSGIFWLWGHADVCEGKEYNYNNGGTLVVEKMRWKIHASDGEPEIADSLATSTSLIFNRPGFAEIVLDAKMIWKQDGETYVSDFKPQVSGLFAFYPVSGKAIFSQFPAGQISHGRRLIRIKSYEFTVKNQHRILNNANDCILAEPLLITSSEISPASHPIQITKVIPEIFQIPGANQLEHIDTFSFLTPMALEADNIALQLGGKLYDNADPDHPNSFGFATIPSIQVFSENELMELSINPAEPITTYEGVETSFDAEVVAAAGIGSGHLCATENTLNLLNGYHVSSVDYIHWFETPLGEEGDWKEKSTRGLDYSHIFEPIIGPGSYTMNCGFVLKLRESDSGDEVPVYLENAVHVDVLPGLRIFSPINELAYPLNVSLKVKTSFDKEKDIWKKIKWRLNGKEYNHGLDEGPFYIELNHTGKWSLQAELTIKNPQTNEDMLLKDRVDFTVNPVEISLTPTRKVLDFSMQKSQELSLNITLNGKKVEKPGKPVEWNDEGLKAVVDPIEWFSATNPDGCAVVDHDESSLIAGVDFTKTGAITMLATITVRLIDGEDYFRRRHKDFEDEFEEPIFSVPATRADLWAVSTGILNEINGLFPEKSIAQAYRTYRLDSFEFNLNHNQTILEKFSKDKGISPPISIAPALAGIASISASLNFAWKVVSTSEIEKNIEEPTRMVIKPLKPCDYRVILQPLLDFASAGSIPLSKIETPANAVSLYSLIETRVDPASFTVTIGEPKILKYVVSSLENNPPPADTNPVTDVIYLLDNSYALAIKNVEWSYNLDSSTSFKNSIESNPYEFSSNMPGKINGEAKGKLEVEELKSLKTVDFDAVNNFSGNVSAKPIQILINGKPLGSESYHMGQKVVLSYKVEPDNLENVVWSVENPLAYKSVMNSRSSTHTVKNYRVEILKEEDLKQKQVEFYLYDFGPDKIVKNGSFTYKISGKEYVEDFAISYSRPYLSRPPNITPPEQKIDVVYDTSNLDLPVWRFGFVTGNAAGAYAKGTFTNDTNVTYRIGTFQLTKINGTRSFIKDKEDNIATTPSILTQFIKTINASAPYSTEEEYWLDTTAPQDDVSQTGLVLPAGNLTIFLVNDIPSIPLVTTVIASGSTYQSGGLFFEGDFLLYIYAKPVNSEADIDPDYYDSIWFPIAVYSWGWKGSASYSLSDGQWHTNPLSNQVEGLSEINFSSFPAWPDMVTTGVYKPKWRDF